MIKFKKDLTVYINNDNKRDSEFTFKRGYSYPYRYESEYIIVGNNHNFDIYISLSGGEIEEWLEV